MERTEIRNIELQAREHPLEFSGRFHSMEEYCLHLMHRRAYEEAARLCERRTVLDLGCNNGFGTHLISGVAASVIGCDVSSSALADARRRYPTLDLRQIDGIRLPFENAAFDVVVSCQVIEHISDVGPYLTEINRVLRPQGVAVFTTPNAAIRLDPGMRPWNRFHVREYRGKELETVLAEFFDTAQVRGLFAPRELYDVEYRRCQAALEHARGRTSPKLTHAAVRTLKALLPQSVLDAVRRGISGPRNNGRVPLPAETLQRFSTADFFYQDHERDDALDLMAVCTKA